MNMAFLQCRWRSVSNSQHSFGAAAALITKNMQQGDANSQSINLTRDPSVWRGAFLWLFFLAPFFFVSYGFATWVTAQRNDVGSIVFAWERYIPFLPWTIVPYWSIDLFYGLSLLVCKTRKELNRHALRLLSGQIIAVTCFLIWPLQATFVRPAQEGLFGALFAALSAFDRPFNQAPSLHIILLLLLWVCFYPHTKGVWRWLLHAWFGLIGISVLTTFQHHFFDIPLGVLVACLCLWLWPDNGASPLSLVRFGQISRSSQRLRLASCYGFAASLLLVILLWRGGSYLWLLWPIVSLVLVALNYLLLGVAGFQKRADGSFSPAVFVLFLPYLLFAWINSRLWTRRHAAANLVADGVWLGRLPSAIDLRQGKFCAVLNLCAELPAPQHQNMTSVCLPVLDLTVPSLEQCLVAAQTIENLSRTSGNVLVCCALGYSRSAIAVAAWLLHSGRVVDVDAALAQVRQARPYVVLGSTHIQVLKQLHELMLARITQPVNAGVLSKKNHAY